MYNIDWSDDIATENVKEQFATLRSVSEIAWGPYCDFWKGCSRSYFLKTHKVSSFTTLLKTSKLIWWSKIFQKLENSDWIKILGIFLLLYSSYIHCKFSKLGRQSHRHQKVLATSILGSSTMMMRRWTMCRWRFFNLSELSTLILLPLFGFEIGFLCSLPISKSYGTIWSLQF